MPLSVGRSKKLKSLTTGKRNIAEVLGKYHVGDQLLGKDCIEVVRALGTLGFERANTPKPGLDEKIFTLT